MNHDDVTQEMPKYKCHKKVHALKISKIEVNADGSALLYTEPGWAPLVATDGYMLEHSPVVGGYYVQYDGGYSSFRPADVFEAGHTRL